MTASKAKAGLIAYIKANAPHLKYYSRPRNWIVASSGVCLANGKKEHSQRLHVSHYDGHPEIIRFTYGWNEVTVLRTEVDQRFFAFMADVIHHTLLCTEDSVVAPFDADTLLTSVTPYRPGQSKIYVWSVAAAEVCDKWQARLRKPKSLPPA
jgi:hypothetical protein